MSDLSHFPLTPPRPNPVPSVSVVYATHPYRTARMSTGWAASRIAARKANPHYFSKAQLQVRQGFNLRKDMETIGTTIYGDGKRLCFLDLEEDLLPLHVQRMSGLDRWDYIKSFMKRQTHHCMKCKVNCNPVMHHCHECLMLTRTGIPPKKKCECPLSDGGPCQFSVLTKHQGL